MKDNPLVSIIVLSADDEDISLECLQALHENTKYKAFEVIVVHNGSSKEQRDFLEKRVKQLKSFPVSFLKNKENLGYAKGNNQAVRKANGDWLCFVNNDVVVTLGWLTKLVSFLKKNPKVAACQPKLHSNVLKKYFDYSGGAGGFIDMFGYPFTRGRVFDYVEKDVGQYDSSIEVAWASGSCLLIKAKVFQEEGGFDEYFFAYMEEIDLCLRLKMRGYQIYCVPEVKVYHYGAYTSNSDLQRKIYLNHRNNLYLVLKHYSIWPYFPILLIRVLFDVLSVVYYLLDLRFAFIVAVVQAYISLVRDIPELIRKRVITWKGRSLLVDDTVYKGSVVVSHFILGRKNYSELMGQEGKGQRRYKKYVEVTFFKE